MNASSTAEVLSPCGCGPEVRRARARALIALALLSLAAQASGQEQEPVTAVWQERLVHFTYRGYAAIYPCSVLENRVALVLTAIGVRPDLEVTANHCDTSMASGTVAPGNGSGWSRTTPGTATGYPDMSPSQNGSGWPGNASEPGGGYFRRSEPQQLVDVRIRLSLPVEITPDVVADMKTDRKRRELVVQVTGDPLPLFDDPIPFTAQRQVLTLSRETGLEAADCELLDQMATSVFKDLGARVIKRNKRCNLGTASYITPRLTVEAFVPVAFKPGTAQSQPGDDDPP